MPDNTTCAVCGATNDCCSHVAVTPSVSVEPPPTAERRPPAPGSRRARLEARMERRESWARKAAARSSTRLESARRVADGIPFGQPILVGHHSEGRARADAQRIHSNMSKGVGLHKLSQHHESRAAGISHQLDTSIFSDDSDAIPALEARIAERTAEATHKKAINRAYKKATGEPHERMLALAKQGLLAAPDVPRTLQRMLLRTGVYEDKPYASYVFTNLSSCIRRDKQRIEEIRIRTERAAAANASETGVVIQELASGYVRVTFAEKPSREVLDALRAAGFHWGRGSWTGLREKLPAQVASVP